MMSKARSQLGIETLDKRKTSVTDGWFEGRPSSGRGSLPTGRQRR